MTKKRTIGGQHVASKGNLEITYRLLNSRLESRESANTTFTAIIVSALFAIYTVSPLLTGLVTLPSAVGSLLALVLLAWKPISELYDARQYDRLVELEAIIYEPLPHKKTTDGSNREKTPLERLKRGEIGLHTWMRKTGRGKLGLARSVLVTIFIATSTTPWIIGITKYLSTVVGQPETVFYLLVFLVISAWLFVPEILAWSGRRRITKTRQ